MIKREGNTRDRILDAAIELFAESGAAAVSIRNITGHVGINESSLYNHFRGKDELLDAIIIKFREEFGKAVYDLARIERDLIGLTPEQFFTQQLLNLRNHITPSVQKMWKIVYLEMLRDKRARDFVLSEMIGRATEYYTEAFRVMVQCGLIKPLDPALLANELECGLLGASLERMLLAVDDNDIMPAVQHMFAHVKFVCEAIKLENGVGA